MNMVGIASTFSCKSHKRSEGKATPQMMCSVVNFENNSVLSFLIRKYLNLLSICAFISLLSTAIFVTSRIASRVCRTGASDDMQESRICLTDSSRNLLELLTN
jgi:hypothetical protein